jgi:uncharacterized membrane protein
VRLFLLIVACALGFLAAAARADAKLTACNQTNMLVTVAVAFNRTATGPGLESRGWWNIKPGRCGPVLDGDLRGYASIFYVAASGATRVWTGYGYHKFCTDFSRAFHYVGTAALSTCPDKAPYRWIIMSPARDYTIYLTTDSAGRR